MEGKVEEEEKENTGKKVVEEEGKVGEEEEKVKEKED